MVTVAQAKHLEFGFSGYGNVFMMLSERLSSTQKLLRVCQRTTTQVSRGKAPGPLK